tara:strand:+ start:2014 stop:2298 length:285 start_codon:yes stop_codon:yes gene_type:complete
MEINIVVISLDRLKELELAEKKVTEPRSKTIIISETYGFGYSQTYKIETDDECTEKLANELKLAKEEIKKLTTEITIEDVKEMNFWNFRKWKKS